MFLENFPGRHARALRARLRRRSARVNERIVYVSCTGFGQSGPYAHRKGYDTVFQAMGGIMSLTGERGGAPVKPGLPVADLTSGLWVAIAILAALQGRAPTGQGCHIDFSMLDGQVALLTLAAARYFALGEVPPRLGTEHPGRVPSASFLLRRRRLAAHHRQRPALAPALPRARARGVGQRGRAAEQRRARAPARGGDGASSPRRSPRGDRDELGAALDAAGVPQGPIRAVDEMLADAHVARARHGRELRASDASAKFPALPRAAQVRGLGRPRGSAARRCSASIPKAVLAERLGYAASASQQLQGGKGDMSETGRSTASPTASPPSRSTGRRARNALNRAMCEGLVAARAPRRPTTTRSPRARARRNGPVFCAGADLKERKGMSDDEVRARRLEAFAAYDAHRALPMPAIAVVHGAAVGSGCEIAAACDFIVATPEATFRTPEALWGTVGATQRLPRVLGKRLAKDLMFTGRKLTAEEAQIAGLVTRIVAARTSSRRRSPRSRRPSARRRPPALRSPSAASTRAVELDPRGALATELLAIEENLARGRLAQPAWRASGGQRR